MKGDWVMAHSLGETAGLPAPFSFLFLTNQGMVSYIPSEWAATGSKHQGQLFMGAIFKNYDPKQNFCLHRSITSGILLQLERANTVSQTPDSFTDIHSPWPSFQPSPGS